YLQDVDVEAHAWSGDNTGISVSAPGTPTFQLLALDEEEYDFTVSPEGPAFIDVSYVITIDSVDYEIAFTGARLVVLPFIQSGDVDEELEYLTAQADGWTSTQRVRLRDIPRQSLSVDYLLKDYDNNRFNAIMIGWSAGLFA